MYVSKTSETEVKTRVPSDHDHQFNLLVMSTEL